MKSDLASLSQIDSALKLLDREIWIITAADGQRRGGLVATWVVPASLDRERPVLMIGIAPNHFTAELVLNSRAFAAHLLRPDQSELAWNFANGSSRNRDKLAGLAVEQRQTGAPILADCLAWFDCQVSVRYDAGDRLLFWGDIVAGTLRVPSAACLREHEFIRNLTDEQRQALAAERAADAAINRPLQERWRSENAW
jgi:flavin reductase (DIM6/NTAB) family NADH-FMN oxidoreductase RutF